MGPDLARLFLGVALVWIASLSLAMTGDAILLFPDRPLCRRDFIQNRRVRRSRCYGAPYPQVDGSIQ
jgi:hypothetical protein